MDEEGVNLDEGNALHERYAGSTQKRFHGYDVGFSFRLKNIESALNYANFQTNKNTSSIPGLAKGQLITTIRFVGGFQAKL